jgi:hypothetical protein
MSYQQVTNVRSTSARTLVIGGILMLASAVTWAITTDLSVVRTLHDPVGEHTNQGDLMALIRNGDADEAFEHAFEAGDEFFETEFNALDGGGANVGDGSRFTRVPRADLTGPGQWAMHSPKRETGPNATSCTSCHIQLFDDGSGSAVGNVHRDPQHSGRLDHFIQRNTPHTFSLGPIQRLAEEMTTELQNDRDAAKDRACQWGTSGNWPLAARGVSYGSIRADRVNFTRPCQVKYDTSNIQGVSNDLVVRPFQWKGSVAFIRDFNRGAAHNEIGIQPVETTGIGVDGDGDGVADEATIGDMTALAVYLAAQPRPTTKVELASIGLIDPLTPAEAFAIQRGSNVFSAVGCANCHIPSLKIEDTIFREPSRHASFRDDKFPAGMDPVSMGVDPKTPVSFDLTKDQPDNQVHDASGNVTYRLGSLRKDNAGRGVVDLYGDLKRHNMGAGMAEAIDEVGTGASVFLTRNLWGVGSTGPYMHDGRATTLTEAILSHGGEAASSRTAFGRLGQNDQKALIAFLDNLVLFKMDAAAEVVVPPPTTVRMNSTLVRRIRR